MRRIFKILSVAASVALSFTFLFGCGKDDASADEYAEIRTAPGTVKVLKDRESDSLREASLKVSMAKNEYEGGSNYFVSENGYFLRHFRRHACKRKRHGISPGGNRVF